MVYRVSILSAAIISALLLPAHAVTRIDTLGQTCSKIQNTISNQGTAILRYPSKRIANYTLYDRYVANSDFCQLEERAKPSFVPAADTKQCRVLKCEEYEPIFENIFNN